ncbi:cyclase family protein [Ferviditalea candida]|uniref:Cyclase family protein n=1 Tax=Ferviditalea candida TaxID=3108399 RepID=A0ABU5ZPG1_9BACL|nr:cyclase family protein [Paenibacillaceae bacterium T2]
MIKVLSHPIRVGDPGWPNNPTFAFEPFTRIGKDGEPANTYMLHLFNHFSSHMDGPNHFNPKGIQLWEVPADRFVFRSPLLVDINRGKDELITVDDIRPYEKQLAESDALLIRTHFTRLRSVEPETYASYGPGISPELAEHLVKNFANLKAIALDFISLAAYQHGPEGVLSHQWMLGNFVDNYILIIEDLNFEDVIQNDLQTVVALPLRIQDVDSAPCTVIAINQRLA